MEPIQQFDWCLRKLRSYFVIVGQDIFSQHYKRVSTRFLAILVYFAVQLFLIVYTIQNYDQSTGFEAGITAFGSIHILMKYIFFCDLRNLVAITQCIHEFYKTNSKRSAKYFNLLKSTVQYCRLLLIGALIVYPLIVVLYIGPKYIRMIRTNSYTPSFNIYFPGFTENRISDMVLLELYSMICSIVSILILIPFDIIVCFVLINLSMIATMITTEVNEFENLLLNGKSTRIEVKHRLKEIIRMQNEYNKLIELFSKGLETLSLFLVGTAFVLGVFSLFLINWVNCGMAYSAIITALLQIMLYCLLGTVVESDSNRVANAILIFHWPLLPLDQQKIYLSFLHHVQQPRCLFIAKILSLNLETSVKILRILYSFSMVLNSMV